MADVPKTVQEVVDSLEDDWRWACDEVPCRVDSWQLHFENDVVHKLTSSMPTIERLRHSRPPTNDGKAGSDCERRAGVKINPFHLVSETPCLAHLC